MPQSRIAPNAIMMGMQDVHTTMLEQTAQNLANANTIGFKAFRTKVKEVPGVTSHKTRISNVAVENIQRSRSSGSVSITKNPYDLAITGSGHFGLQTPNGVRYTRNGQFQLDVNGFIVDAQGNFLLDKDQTPIQIPLNAKLFVSSKGTLTVNNKESGTLGIFYFDDVQGLKAVGYNLSESSEEPSQSTDFYLTQGAVEESNVSIMREAINLINIQRNFEYAQKLLEEYDQQQKKINQINARNA